MAVCTLCATGSITPGSGWTSTICPPVGVGEAPTLEDSVTGSARSLLRTRSSCCEVIGAAGSQYIQPAITQVTLRTLAFGEDPFVAIAAPRIYASATQKDVEVEPGFTSAVYQALVTRGYTPVSRVADIQFGGVHAVYVSPKGKRIGVADPRRDGVAAGQ